MYLSTIYQGVANRDEAEKCVELGRKFLRAGDYPKAIKFLDKSLRLYPLPGVPELKARAEAEARRKASGTAGGGGGGGGGGGSSSSSSNTGDGVHRRHTPRSSSTSSSANGDEAKGPPGESV